jgi:hypothetical protein
VSYGLAISSVFGHHSQRPFADAGRMVGDAVYRFGDGHQFYCLKNSIFRAKSKGS